MQSKIIRKDDIPRLFKLSPTTVWRRWSQWKSLGFPDREKETGFGGSHLYDETKINQWKKKNPQVLL